MADTMQFDLVTPERKLASMAVDSVEIPGSEGEFTALPNHSPFLTTLRPGLMRVISGSEVTEYIVTGGFAEVSPEGATVLAEDALLKSEVTRDKLEALLAKAEAELEKVAEHENADAARRVADHKELLIRHGA